MSIPSIERLVRMADANGYIVVNADGIWQRQADGSPLQFTDSMGQKFSPPVPRTVFNAWRRAKLISQDISASNDLDMVFAILRAPKGGQVLALRRRPG